MPNDAVVPAGKDYGGVSVFRPENLLREARRQRGLASAPVPEICVLDPDGDLVRSLRANGRARPSPDWACYHTVLDLFEHEGTRFGAVGCAVGGPFAVLVAEQLFAAGCRCLVSVTSAGELTPFEALPVHILIDRALRDEGTSLHYLPPAPSVAADRTLNDRVAAAMEASLLPVRRGTSWTTDAPFRETDAAIAAAIAAGAIAVEMEAASLYAFAQACRRSVVCFAHVTNRMAQAEGDFEKGEAAGANDMLALLSAVARA